MCLFGCSWAQFVFISQGEPVTFVPVINEIQAWVTSLFPFYLY